MEWTPNTLEETIQRVNRLRTRYDTLKRRLRRADGVDEIERLDASILRRRGRIRHINGQIERLVEERDRLEGELLGCFHGAEALLVDLIDRLQELEGPSWSPDPLTGFTVLEVVDDVVTDGDHDWTTPLLRPGCPSGRLGSPHERMACTSIACGVLAWKSIDKLLDIGGDFMRAVTEVAMSGRVVEHTEGYRSEVGEIVAVMAFDDARWFRTRNADQIDSFVAAPSHTFDLLAAPIPADSMIYVELDLYFTSRR